MIRFNLQLFGGRGKASGGSTATRQARTRFQQMVQNTTAAATTSSAATPAPSAAAAAPVTPTPASAAPAPIAVNTAQQAQNMNSQTFKNTDTADYHQLYGGRNYFQSQAFGIDTRMALQDYLNDQNMSGSMYVQSQTLNHKMRKGLALTANEQFMVDALNEGMHNLGYNLTLTRYDRIGFMNDSTSLGLGNYENMTETQLKKALIGTTYTDKAFVSTSYNDFKHAPANNSFTDKAIKINYKAKAGTQALMPGNGPGGQLGEIVLAPGQSYKIVDVKYTGKKGRSGASMHKGVEITVEVG